MNSCIVTGAAGFIGSHLVSRLVSAGVAVVGLDNFDPFYDESLKRANLERIADDHFESVELDILDASGLRELARRVRPDVIFHIAALAGVRPSIEAPARYTAVNVDGTVNVLEAARAADCARVVFASSSSVYGNNRKVPFAETDRVDEPISPYAATKRAAELVCHAHSHLFGLTTAALRFFTVYGPAQRPDLAIGKFMRLMAAGRPVPMFGDGSTSRDYTYIDDILGGVMAAATFTGEADAGTCRIFNLGGSSPVTLAELIEAIGTVVEREPVIEQLPMQPGDVDRTYADLTRSHEELGFLPATELREGLARQWAWMKQTPQLIAGT